MPFTAIYTKTNERFNFVYHADLIDELDSHSFICPFCDKPMLPRAGTVRVRRHFFHRFGECGADWIDPEYRNESPEHLAGKIFLARAFPSLLTKPEIAKQATIDFEYIFQVGEGRKRIADVFVTLPGPRYVALEIQLASITPQKLQERTDDYHAAGIDVIWVFGGSADTDPNRTWSTHTQGYSYFLQIDISAGSSRVLRRESVALDTISTT
jgi:competence CoiA-like predicted nuclease